MAKARLYHDKPHARIYEEWFDLPAWQALPNTAKLLLAYILAGNRRDTNGTLDWPVSKVVRFLNCSRVTASQCLTALEKNGWIEVTRVGRFGGSHKPSHYRVTNFACPSTGDLATYAFKYTKNPPHQARKQSPTRFNKNTNCAQQEPVQCSTETQAPLLPPEHMHEHSPQKPNETGVCCRTDAPPPKPQEPTSTQILLRDALSRPLSASVQETLRKPLAVSPTLQAKLMLSTKGGH